MMTAGITAGYLLTEREEIAGGSFFMLITGITVAVFLKYTADIESLQSLQCDRNRGTEVKNRGSEMKKELIRLIAFLIGGFLLLTANYASFEADLTGIRNLQAGQDKANNQDMVSGLDIANGHETTNGQDMKKGQPSADRMMTAEGLVASAKPKGDGIRITLCDVTLSCYASDPEELGIHLKHDLLVSYYGTDPPDPADIIGMRIVADGTIIVPESADNPGCFDNRLYLRTTGTVCTLKASRVFMLNEAERLAQSNADTDHTEQSGSKDQRRVAVGKGQKQKQKQKQPEEIRGIGRMFEKIRNIIQRNRSCLRRRLMNAREEYLDSISDPEIKAFIKGMIFGDKSDINEELREEFNANSTGHILAASGLHIGFLYALLGALARKRRTIILTLATMAIILLYGEMTMWSASTVRAVIVLGISLASFYLKRRSDLLSSVSAAALLILAARPYQLFNTGFQMSFLALSAIAFMAEPLSVLAGEGLAVPLAVQAGLLPVTAYTFHRINLLSIFINIPVIILAAVLVPFCIFSLFLITLTGLAAALSGWVLDISGWISAVSDWMTSGLAELLIQTNSLLAGDGVFSASVTSPGPGPILLIYLILLVLSSEWMRIRLLRRNFREITAALIAVLLISAALWSATFNPFTNDRVVFVSVGQGDCTHIREGNKNILIDGGGRAEYSVGEKVLAPYLLANGADKVDLALVTHLHSDHFQGIKELCSCFPVGALGIPGEYRDTDPSEYLQDRTSLQEKVNFQDKEYLLDMEYHKSSESAGSSGNDTGAAYLVGTDNPEKPEDLTNSAVKVKSSDLTNSADKEKSSYLTNSADVANRIIYLNTGSRIDISDDVWIEPIWPPKDEDSRAYSNRNYSNNASSIHNASSAHTEESINAANLAERNTSGRDSEGMKRSDNRKSADNENENNMVYMIFTHGIKVMVTGDLLEKDELEMVNYYEGTDVLNCDVLKVAHHGSKSSTCEAFLEAASPSIAVIQVGKNNFYGHPHKQTLERLEERGIPVYRTDLNGAIGIETSKDRMKIDLRKGN